MALDMTREELRADIQEIATDVVTSVVTSVVTAIVKENNHTLIRMINEDLAATNHKIDNLDKRLSKRIDETNAILRSHMTDPIAHPHTHAKA